MKRLLLIFTVLFISIRSYCQLENQTGGIVVYVTCRAGGYYDCSPIKVYCSLGLKRNNFRDENCDYAPQEGQFNDWGMFVGIKYNNGIPAILDEDGVCSNIKQSDFSDVISKKISVKKNYGKNWSSIQIIMYPELPDPKIAYDCIRSIFDKQKDKYCNYDIIDGKICYKISSELLYDCIKKWQYKIGDGIWKDCKNSQQQDVLWFNSDNLQSEDQSNPFDIDYKIRYITYESDGLERASNYTTIQLKRWETSLSNDVEIDPPCNSKNQFIYHYPQDCYFIDAIFTGPRGSGDFLEDITEGKEFNAENKTYYINRYSTEAAKEQQIPNYTQFTLWEKLKIGGNSLKKSYTECSTGNVVLTETGGIGTKSYSKDGVNYQSSNVFEGLSSGSHTFYVKDNTCTASCSVTVEAYPAFAITDKSITNATCNGYSNGGVTLTCSGGNGSTIKANIIGTDITRDVVNGVVTFSGLGAGTYSVKLFNDNSCEKTFTNAFTINQPTPISVTASISESAICYGNQSIVNITATGGNTGGYSYKWNGEQTAHTFSDNSFTYSAGFADGKTYGIRVEDSKGCSGGTCITHTDPTPVGFAYNFDNTYKSKLNGTTLILENCNANNASISIGGSGGSGAYTLTRDDANGVTLAGVSKTTPTLPAQLAFYKFNIEDTKGCKGEMSVKVNSMVTESHTITQPCNNSEGKVIVVAAGGDGEYTYTLDNKSQTSSTIFTNSGINKILTVQDGLGCSANSTITLNPSVSFTAGSTMDCNKDKSDIVISGLAGGNESYTYNLLKGGLSEKSGLLSKGVSRLVNLNNGSYKLSIISDGCESVVDPIVVYNKPKFSTFDVVNPNCPGGTANVSVNIEEGSPNLKLYYGGIQFTEQKKTFPFTTTQDVVFKLDDACVVSKTAEIRIPQLSVKTGTALWNCHTSKGKITATINTTFNNYTVDLVRIDGTSEVLVETKNSTPNTSDIYPYSVDYDFAVTLGGTYKVKVSAGTCSIVSTSFIYSPQSYLSIKTVTPVDPVCYGKEGTVKVEVENLGVRVLNVEGTADIAGNCATFRSLAGTRTYKVNDGFCYLETVPKTLTNPTKPTFNGTIVNPPCNGDKAKVIFTEVTPAGAYTYNVDNQSFNTPSFSIPVTGLTTNVTLKVVEMNEKKCESDGQQFTISMPAKLETKFTTDPVKCNGEKNGVIHLDAIGGTKSYTFSEIKGTLTTQISGTEYPDLMAGSYNIKVKDANGCIANNLIEVKQPDLLSFTSLSNLPTCRDGNDGNLALTINGGNTGTYEYKLGSGVFAQLVDSKISGLSTNKYDVTIKDAKGCLATNTGISVDNQPEWIWNISAIDPTCSNNGEITINDITNGYGDYKYYKDNVVGASILHPLTVLAKGEHTVTVIDGKNCVQTTKRTLNDNALKVTPTPRHVTCYKGSDGGIEVKISGGRKNKDGAYTCKLMKENLEITSNVSISSDNQIITYSKLSAGVYSLSVSDASGCDIKDEIVKVTEYPDPIQFDIEKIEPDDCHKKGSLTFTNVRGFQGAINKLVYSVDGMIQSVPQFDNQITGSHTLMVTDSAKCFTPSSITLRPEQISATFDSTLITCHGKNNASITIRDLKGGEGDLTTALVLNKMGESFKEPSTDMFSSKMSYAGLVPGIYSLWSKDAAGKCTMPIKQFEIKEVEPLQLTYGYNGPTCNGFTDGIVNIQVTGGNGAYALNAFGKEIPIAEENGKIGGFAKVEGIKAGTYPITLTDKKSCPNKGTDKITVNEPEPITLKLEKTDDVDCKNYGNGRIYLTAQGGNGGYVFATTKDGSAFKNDANQPSSYLLDKLTPATYAFDIKDSKGCLLSKSIAPVAIKEPDLLTLAADSYSNLTCFKNATGSITVKPSGGNIGAMLYSMNGIEQNSPTFSALPAATHTVTVKDSKGCTANVEQKLTEPTLLEVTSLSEANPLCFESNGSISPVLKGGTAPYYTKVDGYGDYAAPAKVNLPDGSYNLWYKDKNGCEFSLPFRLVQPKKLEINETIKAPLCTGFDGTVTLAATGGTPEYKYKLGTAEYNSANEFTVKRGTFNFSVKDAHGCVGDKQIEVSEPTPLTLASEFANPLCNGLYGTITLSAGGGTLPYYYTNSFTGTFPTSGLLEGGNNQKVTFTGLQPNVQFTPAVKDANGCLMVIAPITLIQPDALSWKPDVITNLRCANDASGAVKVEVIGGTTPYTYRLNDAENATGLFNGLGGGMFNAKVADKNGCELQKSISVFEPTPLSVATSLDPQRCFTLCDGKITAYPSGGTLPYTISWNNPAFGGSNMLANLCGGSYILNVKDGNGCEFNKDLSFATPEQILINVGFKDTTLCKGQTIKVTPEPQKWGLMWMRDGKFLSNGSSYMVTSPGSYIAKAIDAKGCTVDFGFGVTYVNDEMNSDFLISSKVAAADTVAIVDISYPKPAKVEWKYDKNARVISQNDSYLYVVFDEPGTYSLGMVAYTGSCATSVEKRIEVGPKKDKYDIEKSLGYKESILKSFKLYPNPTSGEFKVKVLLNKAADIRLQISAVSNGTILDTKELRGTDTYEVDFNKQELKQGFYIVNLTVEGQTFNLKMVKI
jgi:hypothetical protein